MVPCIEKKPGFMCTQKDSLIFSDLVCSIEYVYTNIFVLGILVNEQK